MPDLTIKAHDRLPSIAATLVDAAGAPVDITGSTVTFIMATATSGTIKVNAAAVIVSGTGGQVRYDWLAADTSTPGSYNAEWQVTFGSGKKQTFPSDGYNTVTVFADLDGA